MLRFADSASSMVRSMVVALVILPQSSPMIVQRKMEATLVGEFIIHCSVIDFNP